MESKPSEAYERKRVTEAARSLKNSASSREIGTIPDIADARRRGRCRKSLKLFCETYNPEPLYFDWSVDHLKAIARIEEAVMLGALYALAMARGSGKSVICRMAALWATSYAHCRYGFVIGATADKANDTLDAIRLMIRFLPLYGEDFPEISHAVRHLKGIPNRANGQTCQGESTLIGWSSDRIVYPTVPPPKNWPKSWKLRADGMVPTSGCLISAAGLTSEGIRGSLKTLSTGEMVRPDFVLLDDPQTPESSANDQQNTKRLQMVTADVLGMAGPGKALSAVMPCTVIERGDMVDQVLDRTKHPMWRGERSGILRAIPTDLAAWDKYFKFHARCAQLEPPDFTESNAYYTTHRAELDAGSEASWPQRMNPGEVSAIQSAMHLFFRDRRGFMAEYMNLPEPDVKTSGLSRSLDAAFLAKRLSGTPRYTVPRAATRLTAMIDCGGSLHWYAVIAWDERYNGTVIDYGPYPDQRSFDFAAATPQLSIRHVHPNLSDDQVVYAGLEALSNRILSRTYPRQDTGEPLSIERCFVDTGWKDEPVMLFARKSEYRALLLPSRGWGEKIGRSSMNAWARRDGEQVGNNWRIGLADAKKGRVCTMNVDHWKGFLFDRLTTPAGGAGCLDLFGEHESSHAMLARHCTAERGIQVEIETYGRVFEKWEKKPNTDNHLWDCLVGCCVAANTKGLLWSPSGTSPAKASSGSAKPIKLSELYAQREAERKARDREQRRASRS